LCIGILKPLLTVLTRSHWIDADKLPVEGGVVLAVNHNSHLDPLTVAHFAYDNGRLLRFLAKREMFDVPLLGTIFRSAQQIPVYRKSDDASRAFGAAVDAVSRGECVLVYPEGTITREPDQWPMTGKTGAARIALASGVPVVPLAQWGTNEILAPYARRIHLFPRKLVTVRAGDPVDLDDLRGEPLTPDVLHEATNRIMDAITGLLEEIRGQQAPAERFDPRAAGVSETGNPNRKTGRRRQHRTTEENR
jgi:1-acyl-sn-glycerol-3-phosphate acyltransferase